MKSRSQLINAGAIFASVLVTFGLNSILTNSKFAIASVEYEQRSEAYLNHLAAMEWEKSFEYLAENVTFRLPDGDTDTRTSLEGKAAVMNFWNEYVQNSGNTKAEFSKYVHVPVEVKDDIAFVGMKGVFNLCYFSAALYFGEEVAHVRMHWAFHFDKDKKIDGIYSYYDRTPIIEVAQKNFLKATDKSNVNEEEVVQIIRLKSDLPESELMNIARERAGNFRALPGLKQKYYLRLSEPGAYAGIYVWRSKEEMMKFAQSELASTIGKAYQVQGKPQVELSKVLFRLRQ